MKAKGFGRRIMAVTLAFSMIWSNGSFTANAEGLQTEQTMERLAETGGVSASDVTGGEVVDPVMAGDDGEANLPTTEEEEENVTKTAVTVGEVEITEMGYENAEVRVIITNPAEETISAVDVVKKEEKVDAEKTRIESLGVYGHDEPGNYTGFIPTNEGELELRVAVADSESNITYLMQEINFTRRDASERNATITFKTGATLSAQAQITPWYSADEYGPNGYELCLHYKVDNESFSWMEAGGSRIIAGSASSTSIELEPETKYLYYAEIKDAKGNAIELTGSAGSQENPFEFTTPEAVTYTRDGFDDKPLYDIIRAQYNASGLTGPLTVARLSAMTTLTIDGFKTDGVENPAPITSLADIPEKMPNLKSLTIKGHNIKDFSPLLGMDYLEDVNLACNDIEKLPERLNECKWQNLNLNYNYINPEEIDASKLPATLEDAGAVVYSGSCRAETTEAPETLYIDDDGKYPLLVKYNGVKEYAGTPYRTYKMTVTIGDETKEYTAAQQSDLERLFAVADLKADFTAITKETDIKATVKFSDEYNDNLLTKEITIRYEERPEIFEECSMSAGETDGYLTVLLPKTYTAEQVKAATVEKDGNVVMSATVASEKLSVSGLSGRDSAGRLYGDFYEYSAIYENGLNYQYTVISGSLSASKAPEAGEYDIVIEFADGVVEGNKLTYPGKFIVSATPMVTFIDVNPSGYDQTGDYYFIRLEGYLLDEEKVRLAIVDADGVEYTTQDGMDKDDYGYVYKLKKGKNWADIAKSTAEYFYVKLVMTDDVVDRTAEEDKRIPISYLKHDEVVAVKSVTIVSEGSMAIEVGGSLQLRAVITPDNATNQRVTWFSSNPAVATVNPAGLVKGLSVGNAVITVVTEDGEKKADFTVHVIDADDSLYVTFRDGKEYEFTGTKITPAVDVVYHGEILTEGVDYTVKYSNNVNASKDNAKVTVTGKTVPATVTTSFVINKMNIDDDAVIAGAIRITKGSKAVPVLYYGNYKLTAKDYDYPDAKTKFDASGNIVLTGKGNFEGKKTIKVTVVTDKKEIGKFKVTKFKPDARTYDGDDKKLIVGKEIVVSDATDKHELTPLAEDGSNAATADYMIVYPEDIRSAGTVKITIVGLNNYVGTATKSYKIDPAKKAVTDFVVSVIDDNGNRVSKETAKLSYRAGGVTPKVNVTYDGDDLVPGKDYKVSYSGNKKVSTDKAKAKCTVTFLGNYKGTAKIVKEFEIVPAGIDAESADVQVVSMDKVFAKAGKYESAPIVTVDSVALSKKDYDVKYTYTQDGKDVELPKKLEESSLKDGALNVKVTVTGKGNYDNKTTAVGYYKIVKLPAAENVNVYDLSKAKVVIRNKTSKKKVSSLPYTGGAITIGGENEIYVTVKVKGIKDPVELKEGQDFEVVYTNNVNKGKATIVLTGLGKKGTGKDGATAREVYGGKTTTFSIGKGILSWL